MTIHTFTVGPFVQNTYLLVNGPDAILIDAGFSNASEIQALNDLLQDREAKLAGIILTHAHIDHVMGLNQLLKVFGGLPVWLNHSDLTLWNEIENQASRFGISASGFSFTPEPLPEQKGFRVGPFRFDVLYTPGHSPDHVSLYMPDEQKVIAGDALFRESIGRTDLYKGDLALLTRSIQEKLYTLPDETVVLPGHGPETTIGYEMRHNPFVRPA